MSHNELLLPKRSTAAAFLALVRRVPFTLVMLAGVLLVTGLTHTMIRPITPRLLDAWGFGLADLQAGRLHTLFLVPFQVYRPYMVLTITMFLILGVGTCEALLGTWRTLLVTWTALLGGYLGTYLLLWLPAGAGWTWARELTRGPDVGASGTLFGALGAVVPFLPPGYRKAAFRGIWIYLVLFLVFDARVWDVNHVIAYAVGLGWGRFFLRRRGERWPLTLPRLRIGRRERPTVAGWLVAGMGLVGVLSSLIAPRYPVMAWLAREIPLEVRGGSRMLALILGFALLVLAQGLMRGKRQAWALTVAALGTSSLLHLLKGPDWPEALLAGVLLAVLLAWRDAFRGRTDPPSRRQGALTLAAVALLLPLYTLGGLHLFRYHLYGMPGLLEGIRESATRLLFADTAGIAPVTRRGVWFLDSISILGWTGILYALVRFLRGMVAPRRTRSDLEEARRLLVRHGRSGTSYMTLWPGNHLFFNPGRTAYVAYRPVGETAIVLGDPVGREEDRAGAAAAFAEFARGRGWNHAFYATGPELLPAYREQGYKALKIGEEAVVPLPGLEFKGKSWQNARTALNRAAREGVRFEIHEGGSVPPARRDDLRELSEAWLHSRKLPPMGFTLGGIEGIEDPNVYVTLAVGPDDRVLAFADWLPVYASRGWVIDLMRRREDAMPGVMDFLIASSLSAFRERGFRTASLATAPLADHEGAGDDPADESVLRRVLALVFTHGEGLYRFRSLYESKERYRPRWQGTWLVYESNSQLGELALAVLRAYLPGLRPRMIADLLG